MFRLKKTVAKAMILALLSQGAIPAFADEGQMREIALAKIDVAEKLRFAAKIEKFENRVSKLPLRKQRRLLSAFSRIVHRARLRVEKQSDEAFAKENRRRFTEAKAIAERKSFVVSSEGNLVGDERTDAAEVNALLSESPIERVSTTVDPIEVESSRAHPVPGEETAYSASIENANQLLRRLAEASSGRTERARALSTLATTEKELSTRVSALGSKVHRQIADFDPIIFGLIGVSLLFCGIPVVVFIFSSIGWAIATLVVEYLLYFAIIGGALGD